MCIVEKKFDSHPSLPPNQRADLGEGVDLWEVEGRGEDAARE